MENYFLYILKINLFAAIIISVVFIIARGGEAQIFISMEIFYMDVDCCNALSSV